jgi:hypothetical protein
MKRRQGREEERDLLVHTKAHQYVCSQSRFIVRMEGRRRGEEGRGEEGRGMKGGEG